MKKLFYICYKYKLLKENKNYENNNIWFSIWNSKMMMSFSIYKNVAFMCIDNKLLL